MASVFLDFVPPDRPGFIKLYVYEAPEHDGPFTLIETITDIGIFPDYITRYSTNLATDSLDWFAITWEDDKGVKTDRSEAVQGGTINLVGKIVSRAMLRNPSLNESIVLQETEGLISEYFNTNDSYSVDYHNVSARIIGGLTLLAVARSQMYALASSGEVLQWTAGLVSLKTSNDRSLSNIELLMKEASRMLGLSISRVAQMAVPEIAGGLSQIVTADISRLQIEVE